MPGVAGWGAPADDAAEPLPVEAAPVEPPEVLAASVVEEPLGTGPGVVDEVVDAAMSALVGVVVPGTTAPTRR